MAADPRYPIGPFPQPRSVLSPINPAHMSDPAPPARRPSWGRIGYILFLLVFTISCVELGARYYLGHVLHKASENKFRFNSYRVYEHVPGYQEREGDRIRLAINANGFRRSEDVPLTKPPGTVRIFFLGGSAAHGISSAAPYPVVHVDQTETVDAHLERLLTEAMPGTRIEVINAAVTGYQVFQHTQYLLTELLSYDPDMVIFFDGANDHYVNDPAYRYMEDFRYQFWRPRLQEPSIGGAFTYLGHWLSRYSAAFRGYMAWSMIRDAVRSGERVDWQAAYVDDATTISNHKAVSRDQFLRAIETNLFLLQRDGVKAVLCLQPMLVLRDTALLAAEERAFLHEDPNVKVLHPIVLDELKEVAQRWRVPLVDLNVTFNDPVHKGRQLLIDYCHLNGSGGEVCAQALLPVVQVLLRPTVADSSVTAPAGSGT